MAEIHNVISLGLGRPAGIAPLTLLGLSQNSGPSMMITLGLGTPGDLAHMTLFGLSPAGTVQANPDSMANVPFYEPRSPALFVEKRSGVPFQDKRAKA